MEKPKGNKTSEQPTRTATGPKDRRRGRPSGRNRVPLTIEERRARNALYERERRSDVANSFRELAATLAVDSNVGHAEILAKAVSFIKDRMEKPSDVFKRQNAKLRWQIKKLTEEVAPFERESGDQEETVQ